MSKNKVVAIFIIIAVVIIGIFAYMTYRPVRSVEDTAQVAEIDKLMVQNIEANYPAVPREVVKLYNKYLMAIYAEDTSDEQIRRLLEKQRELYDDELLEINSFDENYHALLEELHSFRSESKTIKNARLDANEETVYKRAKGYQFALVNTSYFITGNGSIAWTYETYLLRKDATGKWRILGFEKV